MSAYVKDLSRILRSATARNTAIVLVGNLGSGGLRFVVAAMLAKVLSVPEWGTFVLFVTLMDMVSIFADAALNSTLVRFASREPDRNVRPLLLRCLALKAGWTVALAALALLARPLLEQVFNLPQDAGLYYTLAIAAGLMLSFNTFSMAVLQTYRRFVLFALQTVSINILRTILVVGLLYAGWEGLDPYAVVFFGAPALSLLIGGLVIGVASMRAGAADPLHVPYPQLLRFLWPLAAMNLLTVLFQRVDIFLLNSLTTPAEVGQYGLAFQVAFIFPLFTSALFTALLPRVSAMKTHEELRAYRIQAFKLYPVVVLAAVAGAVILPVVVVLIFGDKYAPAIPILRLLILSFGINLLFNPLGLILYALERPHALTWIQALKLPFLVAVDLLLIPAFGGVGAAVGITLVRAAGVVAIVWWTGRLLRPTAQTP